MIGRLRNPTKRFQVIADQFVSGFGLSWNYILHFVEKTFNLPSLGYADVIADDFSDCFDFSQTPLQFQTIPAALKAEYFLNDKTPPLDPDDD